MIRAYDEIYLDDAKNLLLQFFPLLGIGDGLPQGYGLF